MGRRNLRDIRIKMEPPASEDYEWWLQSCCQSIAFSLCHMRANGIMTLTILIVVIWSMLFCRFGVSARFGTAVEMFRLTAWKSDHRQSATAESGEQMKHKNAWRKEDRNLFFFKHSRAWSYFFPGINLLFANCVIWDQWFLSLNSTSSQMREHRWVFDSMSWEALFFVMSNLT